ncbi:Putative transposable element [Caligus rogercresseyi]|uniref:Transposable element n=1 Tax=Caligus rogercresseyi TaxID=217165 RepID=A0A7T8KE97_CALRO|nr:Putative transposable element [Caligus rogercresseyi]
MNFWPKDYWPSQSLDLNPLDFSIWAHVETKACKKTTQEHKCLKGCCQQSLGLHGHRLHPESLWQLQTSPDQCH